MVEVRALLDFRIVRRRSRYLKRRSLSFAIAGKLQNSIYLALSYATTFALIVI